MSTSTAETLVIDQHLAPNDLAAYIDHALTGERRARIEAHLARCPECRAEVSDAARIIATLPRARWTGRRLVASSAAVAAVLLIFLLPRVNREPAASHRESPVTTVVSPIPVSPVGAIDSIGVFSWTSVPHADRYRVRIFDTNGSVLFERATPDTILSLPSSVSLHAAQTLYWQVQADVGFERHTASELVEFSLRRPRR